MGAREFACRKWIGPLRGSVDWSVAAGALVGNLGPANPVHLDTPRLCCPRYGTVRMTCTCTRQHHTTNQQQPPPPNT